MFNIRVIAGSHRIGPKRDKDGNEVEPGRNINLNETFESEIDLVKKYPEKFAYVNESAEEVADTENDLSGKKLSELRVMAEELEIPHQGLSKAQLVAKLTQALAAE